MPLHPGFIDLCRRTQTLSHLLIGVARETDIVIAESTKEAFQLLAARAGVNILDVLEDEQDTGGEEAVAGDVDPFVGGGTLDGDVTPVHDALLARIKDHLEDALDDNGIVNAVDTVHGGFASRSEVNQAAHGSVLDGETGLVERTCQCMVSLTSRLNGVSRNIPHSRPET